MHVQDVAIAGSVTAVRSLSVKANVSVSDSRRFPNVTQNPSKVKLQQICRRKERKIKTIKKILNTLKKKHLMHILETEFEGMTAHVFQNAYKNLKRFPKRKRYSKKIKQFALTLHHYSPKAYNYCRSVLCLPHPSTIKSWASSVPAESGYITDDFSPHSQLPVQDEDCSVDLDSMAIRKQDMVNVKCCIPGCSTRGWKSEHHNGSKLSFHRIPAVEHRRCLWLRKISPSLLNMPKAYINKLRVCGLHFSQDKYSLIIQTEAVGIKEGVREMNANMMEHSIRPILKETAVPVIGIPSHLENENNLYTPCKGNAADTATGVESLGVSLPKDFVLDSRSESDEHCDDVSTQNVTFMERTTKTKCELVSSSDTESEANVSSADNVRVIGNRTVINHEVNLKTEIKQEPWYPETTNGMKLGCEESPILYSDLRNNIFTCSSNLISGINNNHIVDFKTEVKEEPDVLKEQVI